MGTHLADHLSACEEYHAQPLGLQDSLGVERKGCLGSLAWGLDAGFHVSEYLLGIGRVWDILAPTSISLT